MGSQGEGGGISTYEFHVGEEYKKSNPLSIFIKNSVYWLSGFFYSMSLIIIAFFIFTDVSPSTSSISEFLGITMIPLFLAIYGIGVWKAGNWVRIQFKNYWEHQTVPHDEISTYRKDYGPVGFILLYSIIPIKSLSYPSRPKDSSIINTSQVIIVQYLAGVLIIFVLLIIMEGVFGFPTQSESELDSIFQNGNVTSLTAVVSTILGGVIGLLALGTLWFAQSVQDAIIFLVLFIIPILYFLPCGKNMVVFFAELHESALNYNVDRDFLFFRFILMIIYFTGLSGITLMLIEESALL